MEDKKFDQWIKGELHQKESDLNEGSWAKLEFMLDSQEELIHNRRFPFMKVAAAVLLLIAFGGFGYWNFSIKPSKQEWAKTIGELKLDRAQRLGYTTMNTVELPSVDLNFEPVIIKKAESFVSVVIDAQNKEVQQVENMLAIEYIDGLDSVSQKEVIVEPVSVKIVYKRSPVYATIDSPEDTTRRISVKEIVSASKDFQAGELWADVRSAKDKILQDPFGINKIQRQRLK